ncbi:MAG: methylated-DNA--[protein]-cysteine S-methyltransferase [Bacteroidales bacterium]
MQNKATGYYKSPLGTIRIEQSDKGITSLVFQEKPKRVTRDDLFFQDVFFQLDEYFAGKRKTFDLPLDLQGSEFQLSVWKVLLGIPFGKTKSYKEIAKKLKNPKLIRAVGKANAKNPVSIIVPCHRVIGSNGSLTGYAGGLWRKKWLLEHEEKYKQLSLF